MEVAASRPLAVSDDFFVCQMMKGHVRYKSTELLELEEKKARAAAMVAQIEVRRGAVEGEAGHSTAEAAAREGGANESWTTKGEAAEGRLWNRTRWLVGQAEATVRF